MSLFPWNPSLWNKLPNQPAEFPGAPGWLMRTRVLSSLSRGSGGFYQLICPLLNYLSQIIDKFFEMFLLLCVCVF